MRTLRILGFLVSTLSLAKAWTSEDSATAEDESRNERGSKLLPIFQVVRFPNDVCTGTSNKGTCFTAEECSSKGGSSDGSCASGFGVCCVIQLSCGGTTSENNSYIVQNSTTSVTSPCTYTVCPCNNDICRIRYDFTTHSIATQVLGTATDPGVAADLTLDTAVGDCVTDTFTISSPGKLGSPVICGYNTGQHMIIDVGEGCQMANFHIGSSTTTTRQWNIYVTQYTCGQEDVAGPPGCLQYHTGTTGLLKSFGYPSSNTNAATDVSTTHLQNQVYQICIRRESSYCYICYSQWDTGVTGASFGLSLSPAAGIAMAGIGTACIDDYIVIPGVAEDATIANPAANSVSKICGRLLARTASGTEVTVCSRNIPFRVGIVFDDQETCIADVIDANKCETDLLPGGITGFALGYIQKSC